MMAAEPYKDGYHDGYDDGVYRGYQDGVSSGRDEGYEKGYSAGHDQASDESREQIEDMDKRLKYRIVLREGLRTALGPFWPSPSGVGDNEIVDTVGKMVDAYESALDVTKVRTEETKEWLRLHAELRQGIRGALFRNRFWPNNPMVGDDEIIDAVSRLMDAYGDQKEEIDVLWGGYGDE